ncbi:MAG TPA: hypothetical protein VGS12_13005 [Caulobacteraceae bacterium]|nr:hypothetical protein [Caulobacteraceae bacterium]
MAAREMAERKGSSVGRVLSELARKSLVKKLSGDVSRHGIPVIPRPKIPRPVTLEIVNALRDEDD